MQTVHERLDRIEKEISNLKEDIYDSQLSQEDLDAIKAYKLDKKEDKLTSHSELRQKLEKQWSK